MKRLIAVAVAVAASATFAECQDCTCKTGNTPHIEQKVRSPLGKEIDATRHRFAQFSAGVEMAFRNNYVVLTNLAARVEALEAAESNRVARLEAAKKARAERQAAKKDNQQILRDAIRRGKKVEKGGK